MFKGGLSLLPEEQTQELKWRDLEQVYRTVLARRWRSYLAMHTQSAVDGFSPLGVKASVGKKVMLMSKGARPMALTGPGTCSTPGTKSSSWNQPCREGEVPTGSWLLKASYLQSDPGSWDSRPELGQPQDGFSQQAGVAWAT